MSKKEERNILIFPTKKNRHNKRACTQCDECEHRVASAKFLALAIAIVNEIPLNHKRLCGGKRQ